MGFNMFARTRLQSLWIMFLEWSEKPNAGHIPFETVTINHFNFFLRHDTLISVSAGFCQSTFITDPCIVVLKRYIL